MCYVQLYDKNIYMFEHYDWPFQKRIPLRVRININCSRMCYAILNYTVKPLVHRPHSHSERNVVYRFHIQYVSCHEFEFDNARVQSHFLFVWRGVTCILCQEPWLCWHALLDQPYQHPMLFVIFLCLS